MGVLPQKPITTPKKSHHSLPSIPSAFFKDVTCRIQHVSSTPPLYPFVRCQQKKKSLLLAYYSEQLTVKQQHGIVGWNQGDFSGLKLVKPLPSGSQARLPSQLTLVVPWLLPEMCRRDTDTIPTANPLFSGDHFHGQGRGGERRALLPFILFFFFLYTHTHTKYYYVVHTQ